MADEIRIAIAVDPDMVKARAEGRALAARLGFSRTGTPIGQIWR